MSSYVVPKSEYIKAAGIIAGIVTIKNNARRSDFWVYDYELRRNMQPNDYYIRMAECYDMNAISVQEQYGDSEPERDNNQYLDIFLAYKRKGMDCAMNPEKLRKAWFVLNDFFRCAEYQTEKYAYLFRMKMLFNEILVQLMRLTDSRPEEGKHWSDIDM